MRWILIVLVLGMCHWLTAQITYNKRLSFGCGPSVLSSLETTDSCIYIVGVARDSAFSCQVGIVWATIDSLGNLLTYVPHGIPTEYTETWTPRYQLDVDGNFITGGNVIDSIGLQTMLIKWDSQGNVLWKKNIEVQL